VETDITVGRYGTSVKQKQYEFDLMLEEVSALKPEVAVEIGILRGGVLSAMNIETKIGIDINPQKRPKDQYIIDGDSHDLLTVKRLDSVLNEKEIDFLFIDGDHSYNGVKRDYELYSPFVRKGGIIGFHDILDTPYHRKTGCLVAPFWKELKSHGMAWREIIDPGDITWGGIGLVWKG